LSEGPEIRFIQAKKNYLTVESHLRGNLDQFLTVASQLNRDRAYVISRDDLPAKGMHISRADVADFMMRQATSDDYLYKVPAIAY
jgi:hypothetical protein